MVRYTFDEWNRLLVEDAAEALRPKRMIEGRVRVDRTNRLIYEAVEPVPGQHGSRRLVLEGIWGLTQDHALTLTARQTAKHARSVLQLAGALVQANAHELVFALRQSETDDLRTAQRISLSGRWQADARNRLTFLAEQADGSEDRLTLQAGWEVGPDHTLRYRYRQRAGVRRIAREHTLIFEGAWDVAEAHRLVYRLSGSSDSSFEFKASLQSPTLRARRDALIYQVGIALSSSRTQRRRVTLHGAWKINRDLSVSFEIPYAGGRVEGIDFKGTAALGSRDQLAVTLRTRRDEPLGITVLLTHEVTPDARLFLRLRKSAEESSAIGGVQVRF